MSENPQMVTIVQNLRKDSDAPRPGTGLRGIGTVVVGAMQHLAKGPMYMVFAFSCLSALVFVALRNHEPIAMNIGILATAVFGSGLGKTYVDQKFNGGSK